MTTEKWKMNFSASLRDQRQYLSILQSTPFFNAASCDDKLPASIRLQQHLSERALINERHIHARRLKFRA